MNPRTMAIVAMALCLSVATAVSAQTVTKTESITTTATIQAIDSTARTVTLRDDKGQEDIFAVGPDVKRFDELKVGDTVKMTYIESLVLQVRKPGEQAGTAGAAPPTAAVTTSKGPLPGGTVAIQEKMTVTVKAIDPDLPSVTVTTPEGRTVTRKVEDKKNIEGLRVGDQIDITYTLSIVTNIERAK